MFGTVAAYTVDSVRSSYSVDGFNTNSYYSPVGHRLGKTFHQIFSQCTGLDIGWHTINATVDAAGEDFAYWLDYITYDTPQSLPTPSPTPCPTIATSVNPVALSPTPSIGSKASAATRTAAVDTVRAVVPPVVILAVIVPIIFVVLRWRARTAKKWSGGESDGQIVSGTPSPAPIAQIMTDRYTGPRPTIFRFYVQYGLCHSTDPQTSYK